MKYTEEKKYLEEIQCLADKIVAKTEKQARQLHSKKEKLNHRDSFIDDVLSGSLTYKLGWRPREGREVVLALKTCVDGLSALLSTSPRFSYSEWLDDNRERQWRETCEAHSSASIRRYAEDLTSRLLKVKRMLIEHDIPFSMVAVKISKQEEQYLKSLMLPTPLGLCLKQVFGINIIVDDKETIENLRKKARNINEITTYRKNSKEFYSRCGRLNNKQNRTDAFLREVDSSHSPLEYWIRTFRDIPKSVRHLHLEGVSRDNIYFLITELIPKNYIYGECFV